MRVEPRGRVIRAYSAVNRPWAGGSGEQAKALRLDDGSRMNREVHVRFCERRGVRFPPATHPIYAEWERGEFGSVEWADPEIEWVMTGGPAPGSSTRLAGMAEGWRNFLSAWDWYRVEADEYRELDDGRVLVLI